MAKYKYPPKRDPGLIDSVQAATLLELSKSSFHRYRRTEADFPRPAGREGHAVLYRKSDVEEWKTRRQQKS